MRRIFSAIAIAALPFSVFAAPQNYTLDPNHTNITWHANHLGFSTPSGKFNKVEGTLVLDEAAPASSKISVKIDMASVNTGIVKFDEHLKSKDFFEVEKYPTATFVSDKVEVTGQTAKVTGTLTLHGVAKPAVLDVKLNKIGEFPMTGKKTAGFTATTTVKRSEFGMGYGTPGVADDVLITMEVEATIAP